MGELQEVEFTVQTVSGPETIHGMQLGTSSSYRGSHNHVSEFANASAGERCSACRWMEVTIVFDVAGEQYIVVISGRSRVPGEIDRCRVERTTSPVWVIETLSMPQRRPGDTPKLSKTALRAVTEAARFDADIADAYAHRRRVVG